MSTISSLVYSIYVFRGINAEREKTASISSMMALVNLHSLLRLATLELWYSSWDVRVQGQWPLSWWEVGFCWDCITRSNLKQTHGFEVREIKQSLWLRKAFMEWTKVLTPFALCSRALTLPWIVGLHIPGIHTGSPHYIQSPWKENNTA